ncbi:phage baseplate plug family protein [Clostridium haemolyticum]|uniref:phage baseplate plug family protein n=1 Tax=Clostridium haemolyticum TaxID=84025 RepID=UPI00052C2D72|nr:hypothetical protein [Clostridium haemolyticum]KGN04169.1 hypothetical protein Z961_04250 [Clostridium haemolyticum NCTC 8350]
MTTIEIIDIDKNMIPYEFELELSNRIYTFEIDYNFMFDFLTVTLKLNDKVLATEKAVLNEILFKEFYIDKEHNFNEEFPKELLYFGSNDNNVIRLTFDNLGEEVNLYCINPIELEGDLNE